QQSGNMAVQIKTKKGLLLKSLTHNPDVLWVAVLGHLYSPNAERGVYKTTNGGKNWKKVLFVNENAGAIDLVMDPTDKNTLYASTWHRERRAWNFVESGVGSGIHKSTDGGETWQMISGKASGFPHGEGAGRIGLAAVQQNDKTLLYAIIDNYFRRPKEKKEGAEDLLVKDDLREMTKEEFLKLEEDKLATFLRSKRFPKKYGAKKVMTMVKEGKIQPNALVEYLEDANSLLFDTPVTGAEVYRSEDGGKTWQKTHEGYLDDVYYSYGYYFGQIRVAADNPDKIYIYGVPVLRSDDGGKTFQSINGANVHVDHHALWVNPNRPGHLILGNDGGVNISYDDGEHWFKCNSTPVGQFYYVAVDMAKPYKVYGGLQDNGVWVGPSTYKASDGWHNSGQYPYKSIMGGDGMQIAIDTRDNNTVYTGYQFGNYFRINQSTGARKYITPKHELGERPFRWNWQTPIHLSIHNQDILYMCSNKVHRSFNQGNDFEAISDDLTTGGRKGDVAFSTLTTIHESPLRFGLLYVGSDDGLVHVSKDAGNTWTNITGTLPKNLWVSRIQASTHDEATVYLTLNGYRWDDFASYVYRSTDYGKTWTRIATDLPMEPANVIKEDPVNAQLLYVGTDHGLYVSMNAGQSFMHMGHGLPATAVHDVVVHPREKDLIVATHGRSFYVANVAHLQQLKTDMLDKPLYAFDLSEVKYRSRWGSPFSQWSDPIDPDFSVPFYSQQSGNMAVQIKTKKGLLLKSLTHKTEKGINYLDYDLTIMESAKDAYETFLNTDLKKKEKKKSLKKAKNGHYYLMPGTYEVEISKDGVTEKQELTIVD
ncbi:MAG: glycosyl hydrolase, partial [Bacteroidota bacterium]